MLLFDELLNKVMNETADGTIGWIQNVVEHPCLLYGYKMAQFLLSILSPENPR